MIKRFYILLLAIVASVGMMNADVAKLPGAFTINASGDKIVFSKGNLQATTTDLGANWTWDFAPNQWSLIGNAVANNAIKGNKKVSANGTVDLFGWSTAATYYGINESWKNADYAGDFVDWGALMGTEWRTLSRAEFYYIVYSRTDAYKKRGQATVNGVPGYVILPDAWTLPSGLSFTNSIENYTTNQYDGADWTAMESAGAVFFPAAGVREGSDIYQVNLYGWYWASTPNETDGGNAYYLYFDKSSQGVTDYYRWKSKSVRLVTAAPIPPYEAVMNLINAIGTVELTAECKAKIDAARTAYDALSDGDKAQVTNYSTLQQAEAAYTALNQAEADKVIAKIAAIPTPVTLKLATRDAIESASAAYEALNAEQKLLVSNYDVLTAAEATMATLNPGGAQTGAVNGKFSISNGNQIAFSKGNLQYQASTGTWRFAANQYDAIGDDNSNISPTYTGWIDLFGWGTGSNPTITSTNNDDYTIFVDWGDNAISNGGNEANLWRTLTNNEWKYLFQTRTDAASKYGIATVADVHGLIILPDDYAGTAISTGSGSWDKNTISAEDWAAYEAKGAVFLPTTGYRYGTTVNGVDARANYWSSTFYMDGNAYDFGIEAGNIYPQDNYPCGRGFPVRLVTENAGSPTPLDSAQAVKDLIEAIPTPVTLDAACVNAVQAARDAYNKLAEATKGALDAATVNKLNQAITDYTALIQAGADAVTAKINAIPQPVTLKLATRDSIESARAAYDALTADQKALVTNYDVLTDAEATWAGLINATPAGALSGKYTINDGGDFIYFAHGNLQYTRENLDADWSTGTFRLATNQYDLIEAVKTHPEAYCTDNYGDKTAVGLFGWGTWGEGKTPNLTSSDKTLYTWSTDFSGTLEGTNTWRTLTKDEWVYLLTNHNMTYATVHDVNGLLVAPDGKDIDGKSMEDWVVINDETWTTMQNDGYLFLPACGQRNQMSATAPITTGEQGEDVVYYSSTEKEDDANKAYNIWYKKGQAPAADDFSTKRQAFGVRLVSAGVNPLDQAQAVKDLIDAIPAEITLDEACVNAIEAARAGYDALDTDAKAILDAADVQKLTDAEADLAALNQAEADKVVAKINNIPTPVELKLATRDSIESARAAYDALNAAQQALVTNYQTLLDAEAALAALNPGGGMPADALNGKFTINAGGDQISFAKGNLQATTEDLGEHWTWGFAANQWNCLMIVVANSKINGNGTVSENGTVDLFGWSTAATYYGINNSDKFVDYPGDFVDWGPNMGAGWRTLTKDEWNYLIENNTKGRATVNDKNGYIFLPNDWSGPAFTPDPNNFTTNVYSGDDWTAMENAGAVFLPCGPARLRNSALVANDVKYYSSTSLNNETSYVFTIYYDQSQSACTVASRAYGCMVRLVTEGSVTPLDSAQVVKDLIDAIPTPVTLEDACVKAIEDARDAYNKLAEATKGALDPADVKKLTDAEADLTALNQAEADKVIAKINAIPTPVELKLATRDSIESARAAYDALTAEQKALVSNYTKLTDAEAALAELNKGGSASVDIVWDINTGIANVNPNTTSPAYEGITITTGNGNRFYQTTTDPNMLRFFFTGSAGSYAFAKEDGSHFTKVVLISSVEMSDWLINPSRIGTDWAVSDENKKATWTGDADTVKIWDGVGATNWVDVDSIVFTVSGTATPLDSAQHVKDLIDAIPTPVEYPTSGPAIAAALVAYQQLSDAAKGALDDADVQKMTDAATQYAALDAIAAIEAIPAEIVYDPAVKAAIETARKKYDALIDASKALVSPEVLQKLIDAEEAWAILVAKIEHNVSYIGKDGELKNETVALLHIPDPAPDYNGYEFVRWDVKAGDFLEEGLRIKAVYTPIITTNPVAYDTLVYNGTAQTLIKAGVTKEGNIEYRLNDGEWSTELPKATNAAAYVVYYKLVREAHDDYVADPVNVTIAKAPVAYTAPTAYDTLVYNATNQTLIAAGQTNDGTFEYSFNPTLLDSWNTELLQAMAVGTYNVYYRVKGDLNHLDSTAVDPVAVSIAKAPLTATADDKSIIYGDLAPEFTVTYAGWQGTEGASVLTGEIAYACEYVKGNPVGEYVITPSGVDAANYTIEFVKGKLTVNSKSAKSDDITAKQADNEMLVYDAAANKPTIQAKDTTKTLIEDTDYKLTFIGRGATEYAESATAPVHVGEYTAIVAFIGNYTDTLTVDFVINKAPLTITADDKEVTFGEFAPEFTVSYKGWQGNDTATVLTGDQTYACEYKRGDKIGEYTIIPSGVDAHDYAITFVNGTLTVNRKSAKSADIAAKQADNEKLVYDAEANRPTIQVKDTTLVLTEAQDYVLTFMGVAADQTPYAESETAPTHVGNYKAIVAFIGNYIDTLTVDFTINKAPLTITANDTAMIYGDVAPAFTVSYNGWFGNDDESVILGTQAYDCVYAPGSPIGTYAITPKGVEAYDYAITFVDGKLTVNKAHVFVSGAEVHTAKFADGHANAEVINNGILNGIKVSDPIAHITTAAYSSADVAEHLTITLFYELTGDTTLLKNYYLEPTQEVFTTEGVIIEPFIPNDDHQPEEGEQVEVQEGIDVYAYGYCDGSGYSLKYHLNSGNPDQYKINFEDNRFTDIDWTNLATAGKDGTIEINIPVDLPTGDYSMTVYFRDSRFDWLESQSFTVTFHVNLPETYVRPLFDNVIALIDTCNCLTDIQWYWRANSSDTWQPIPGANGYYYHSDTKLEGEYFVSAKMNGEPTYTCGQSDMETLYGDTQQQQAQVKAYPNPVVNATTVTIENSLEWNHNIRIVNLMGVEVLNTTFEGNETSVEMSTYPQGNYMISVDGIVVKVMKQ